MNNVVSREPGALQPLLLAPGQLASRAAGRHSQGLDSAQARPQIQTESAGRGDAQTPPGEPTSDRGTAVVVEPGMVQRHVTEILDERVAGAALHHRARKPLGQRTERLHAEVVAEAFAGGHLQAVITRGHAALQGTDCGEDTGEHRQPGVDIGRCGRAAEDGTVEVDSESQVAIHCEFPVSMRDCG